LFAFKCVWAA